MALTSNVQATGALVGHSLDGKSPGRKTALSESDVQWRSARPGWSSLCPGALLLAVLAMELRILLGFIVMGFNLLDVGGGNFRDIGVEFHSWFFIALPSDHERAAIGTALTPDRMGVAHQMPDHQPEDSTV